MKQNHKAFKWLQLYIECIALGYVNRKYELSKFLATNKLTCKIVIKISKYERFGKL